jgi:hypothetical protein
MESLVPWSEDQALQMELTILNTTNRDLNRMALRLGSTRMTLPAGECQVATA